MNTLTPKQIIENLMPFLHDLQQENFTDQRAGIFENKDLTKAYLDAKEYVEQFRESVQPVSGVSVEELAEKKAEEIANEKLRYSGEEPQEYLAYVNGIKDGFISGYQSNTGVSIEEYNITKTRLELYREQTQKLGKYLNDNNIGKPNQGFYDAIIEHLQSNISPAGGYSREQMEAAFNAGLKTKWEGKVPKKIEIQKAKDNFFSSLPPSTEGFVSDAVKFKKWCDDKTWELDNREQHTHTVEELYKIFKSTDVNNISQQGEQC